MDLSIMRTSNAYLFSTAVGQGKHNDAQVMVRTSPCCQIEISHLTYLNSQCLSAADTGFTLNLITSLLTFCPKVMAPKS